jgi:hypothetical protein
MSARRARGSRALLARTTVTVERDQREYRRLDNVVSAASTMTAAVSGLWRRARPRSCRGPKPAAYPFGIGKLRQARALARDGQMSSSWHHSKHLAGLKTICPSKRPSTAPARLAWDFLRGHPRAARAGPATGADADKIKALRAFPVLRSGAVPSSTREGVPGDELGPDMSGGQPGDADRGAGLGGSG